MVTIRVASRLFVEGASEELKKRIREEFTYANPEWGKAARFGGRVAKAIPKTIATWRDEADGVISIPRGAMGRLRALLHSDPESSLRFPRYEVRDEREHGELLVTQPEDGYGALSEWTKNRAARPMYTHQNAIVAIGMQKENLLVRSPTGSGKTIAELAFILQANRTALVMVPSVKLAEQWIREASKETGWPESWFGMYCDGVHRWGPISVGLPGTIGPRIAELAPKFGTFVVDEVQRCAAEGFANVVDQMPARYRLGVSADERRQDRKEFLIRDSFGDVELEVKREDLVLLGVVLDVEIRMVPTTFDDPKYREVKKREREHAERVRDGEKVDPHSARRMKQQALEAFTQLVDKMGKDEARNMLAVELARSSAADENPCLVFLHRREHAEILEAQIAGDAQYGKKGRASGIMLGSKASSKEFDRTCAGIRDGSVLVGVGTYQAMGVGIDLPAVSRGVAVTPIHTNRTAFGQLRGRICRRGSKDAILWVLWDELVFDLEPLAAMVKWNKCVRVLRDGQWVDGKTELQRLRKGLEG